MGYSARRGFTNGKISGAARQAELQQKIAAMQEKMTEAQDAVEAQEFTASVGGGVVDRLRQMKRSNPQRFKQMEIFPVKFGQRIKHAYYYDSTTYMMSVVRNLLSPHDEDGKPKPVELILPDDADLIAQLSTRKYEMTDDSRQRVESKDAIKKRGGHSPDEADCILLCCLPVKFKKERRQKT